MVTAAVVGRQLRVSAYQSQELGEVRREVVLEPTLISENFLFLRQAILAAEARRRCDGVVLCAPRMSDAELQRVATVLDQQPAGGRAHAGGGGGVYGRGREGKGAR